MKRIFVWRTDGTGRRRFFIDGSETTYEDYLEQFWNHYRFSQTDTMLMVTMSTSPQLAAAIAVSTAPQLAVAIEVTASWASWKA